MIMQSLLAEKPSEVAFVEVLRTFAEHGYRVTMVFTRHKYPDGVALRPSVMKYTHDIHFLPSFLRMHDFPGYIRYLALSRGIDTIIASNCQMFYQILPSLSEMLPHVKFVDYLHDEAFGGWKTDDFPMYPIISQRFLDRTVVCSSKKIILYR